MPRHLLIADDSVTVRRFVKDGLKRAFDVVRFADAGSGREAIERAHEAKPDLIILDVSMSDLDGLQAAKVLKNEMPDVPIVLFTMHNLGGYEPKNLGVDAIVQKLDGVIKLSQCVKSLLAAEN